MVLYAGLLLTMLLCVSNIQAIGININGVEYDDTASLKAALLKSITIKSSSKTYKLDPIKIEYSSGLPAKDSQKAATEKLNNIKRYLLLLFDRPFEPVFFPKGPRNTVFVLPDSYWVGRYQHLKDEYSNIENLERRFGPIGERVVIKDLSARLNNLTTALSAGPDVSFAKIMLGDKSVSLVVREFMDASLEDWLSIAVYVRDRMNPYFFSACMFKTIYNREETVGFAFPSLAEVFPQVYINGNALNKVREESFVAPEGLRTPVEVPLDFSGSKENLEQRLAFFREDVGLNTIHRYLHFIYTDYKFPGFTKKDRPGEIFYYFHQQALARYDTERFCQGLPKTEALSNFREPIKEGYFPKQHSCAGNRVFPGRSPNTLLEDVYRAQEGYTTLLSSLESWRDRLVGAIKNGSLLTNEGEYIAIDATDEIDTFAGTLESNGMSVNRNFYGSLHNTGHVVISMANDPKGLHLEDPSTMLDQATSMRDTVFYRWHTLLDDIFEKYKNTLPSYTEEELGFEGVKINSAEVNTQGEDEKNTLFTMWQQSELDVSRGMDFTPKGRQVLLFTHAQHEPFFYKIQVDNRGKERKGTVRIFLAPKFNEKGDALELQEQKSFFMELDRFVVNLKQGANTVRRSSQDSTVTIPYESLFRQPDALSKENKTFSGCGWPHYMLLPTGSAEGMEFQLFVMVSDYEKDKVEESQAAVQIERGAPYCGQRGKYPDRRAMGYPFDRLPPSCVDTLEEFLTPNMIATDVVIYHSDSVVELQS